MSTLRRVALGRWAVALATLDVARAEHTGASPRARPAGAPATQPRQILEGTGLPVASSSNIGAPLEQADQAPGAVLTLQPQGAPFPVLASFATSGTQATNNLAFMEGL
jgi:hypothetical protein